MKKVVFVSTSDLNKEYKIKAIDCLVKAEEALKKESDFLEE